MKYYIIAGEASGDLHGAGIVAELRKQDERPQIRAWGGDLMRDAGAEVVKHTVILHSWDLSKWLKIFGRSLET